MCLGDKNVDCVGISCVFGNTVRLVQGMYSWDPCLLAAFVNFLSNYLTQELEDVFQNVNYVKNVCGRDDVPAHKGARMPPAFRKLWLDPVLRLASYGKDGMREVDHKWKDSHEMGAQDAGRGCTAVAEKLCAAAAEGSTAAVKELRKATAEAGANELVVVALGRCTAQHHTLLFRPVWTNI
jgi:hypothetical protein